MTTWRPGPDGPEAVDVRVAAPVDQPARAAGPARPGAGSAVHSSPAARSRASVVLPTPSGPTRSTACGAGPRTIASTARTAAACPRVLAPSIRPVRPVRWSPPCASSGASRGRGVRARTAGARPASSRLGPASARPRSWPRSCPPTWSRPACAPPAPWLPGPASRVAPRHPPLASAGDRGGRRRLRRATAPRSGGRCRDRRGRGAAGSDRRRDPRRSWPGAVRPGGRPAGRSWP